MLPDPVQRFQTPLQISVPALLALLELVANNLSSLSGAATPARAEGVRHFLAEPDSSPAWRRIAFPGEPDKTGARVRNQMGRAEDLTVEQSATVWIREALLADAPAIARVHVESWRTTYCGIVADDFLARLSYEDRTSTWTRGLSNPEPREFHYVAEDESDGVVGFVSGGPERSGDPVYPGELYRIWLLERHQRRGIGRRLVQATVERLAEQGLRSMLVWVLADNPSRGFYEALGGQYVRRGQTEIGGAFFAQVAYGWSDTSKIGSD